jgi:Zn-finger domain-containing protein
MREMRSSLALVEKANLQMDEIAQSGSFSKSNMEELIAMRDDMVTLGFNSPFSSILLATQRENEERCAEEMADIKKQITNIKYIARLKLFTLNRIRIAIAAHRVAFSFQKIGKTELIPFLPLGGDYIRLLALSGNNGILAYRTLMDAFSNKKSEMEKVTVLVEFEKDGKKEKKEFSLSNNRGIKEKIRRIYGDKAKVLSAKKSPPCIPLIKSRAARVSLLSAIVFFASEKVRKQMEEEERENKKLSLYGSIMRKHRLLPEMSIESVEGFEEAKKELEKEGLLTHDGIDWRMDEELREHIKFRDRRWKQLLFSHSSELLLSEILKFYITTGSAERQSDNLFPSLAVHPTEKQLGVLNFLKWTALELPNAAPIVSKKLEAEKIGLKIPPPSFGAAFFSLETGRDPAWCSRFFGVPESDVSYGITVLSSLKGRGAEFLKLMKREKKEV